MKELPHEKRKKNISRVSHGNDPGWGARIYVISEEPVQDLSNESIACGSPFLFRGVCYPR